MTLSTTGDQSNPPPKSKDKNIQYIGSLNHSYIPTMGSLSLRSKPYYVFNFYSSSIVLVSVSICNFFL